VTQDGLAGSLEKHEYFRKLPRGHIMSRFISRWILAFWLIVFLGSVALSQGSSDLVGHWRFTYISYTGARDTHLVLAADGSAALWSRTAYDQSPVTPGTWSSEGNMLYMTFSESESAPFTFYQGQLIYPNIQGRRRNWERIE
jgi:hypothetical protein